MAKKINRKKIYVSLYILIPLIYSGISIISVTLTYQITTLSGSPHKILPFNLIYLTVIIGIISFIVSIIILKIILKPMMQFINKTQEMPLFTESHAEKTTATDDLIEITNVLQKVTNILSHVDAKELFPEIISASSSLRNIFSQIIKIAPTDSTVLISGESGTGKELIASSIYEHSLRKGKPFIKINCVAIPEGLLESELFGHEKGSFTGAISQKKGKFEIADHGTIFLDEIGDMPLATQAKLLRVLQEKEFERVGGTATIKVDVRFIAATNKNLQKMMKDGTFREDLYFRINVFSIFLLPLRERGNDISLLTNHFLRSSVKSAKLSPTALQILVDYSWPGNIRELKNVLEQAEVLCEDGIIEPRHLPEAIVRKSKAQLLNTFNENSSIDTKMAIIEREMIIDSLKRTGGIQVKAANLLGINQRSLWHRIKKLNIDINNFKHLQ